MTDNDLRIEVKHLKVFQGVSYRELASYLEIRDTSFYHWLKGEYDFSDERKARLKDIIDTLVE